MKLRVEGLLKRRGNFLLDVPAFEVGAGEPIGLCGPNASGKTTLLEVLAGLLPADAGSIQVGEEGKPETPKRLRKRFTMLFQRPVLFRGSALSNVMFPLRVTGHSRQEARRRAEALLERVAMEEFRLARVEELSGGQAQRVALARALAVERDGYLFDEPLSNLDAVGVGLFEGILTELANRGKFVLLSIHQVGWGYNHCGRIFSLVQGRLLEGSPENIFRGELRADGTFVVDNTKLGRLEGEPGTTQVIINPRAVTISHDSRDGCLKGEVVSVARAGSGYRVRVDVGVVVVAVLECKRPPIPGEEVFVKLKCERL